jgi:hypothetical protein
MVSVDNKQIVFIDNKTKKVVLRRDALFAHRCPKCATIIQGLLIHKIGKHEEDVLPEAYRQPDGHARQINFKMFAEPNSPFITVPDYMSPLVDLGHVCGQFFYDAAHFAQSKFQFHGRCKYSRAVFQFDRSKKQEALRLAGILKVLYGTDDAKWVELREKLETVPGMAEEVIKKVLINAGAAPDIIGKNNPVVLIAKDDWDYKSFGTLVDECLAWQPVEQGAIA